MSSKLHGHFFQRVLADLCQQHSTKAIYTRFDFVSLDQEVVKNRIESMTMLKNPNQFQHMLAEIFLLF
jgi:hypothetical protein